MAIDHRIIQSIGVRDNRGALDVFQNALTSTQNRKIQAAQEERRAEIAPFQLQQAQQNLDINQQAINQERQNQRLVNIHQTGQRLKPFLESGDIQGAEQFLLGNIAQIQARIDQGSGEDITESMDALAKLQAGDTRGLLGDINAVSGLINKASPSASQREFTNLLRVAQDPNSTELERKSAERALGATAKVSSSAAERIASDPELATSVAESQAEIAGAKAGATEGEKLKQQRKHKPAITALVKLAEKEAIERGDVLTDLSRMEAGLPGLKDAVSQLKELSALATSTFGGKVFDQAVKQTGFGSTKGSTARAKMKAIIANQTLPLLKETFGSAFTEAEGARLEASFADPDATHEERLAQLDAFIDQKERSIRTKKAQVNETFNFDAQGNLIE